VSPHSVRDHCLAPVGGRIVGEVLSGIVDAFG
jgi:hypothetical protein